MAQQNQGVPEGFRAVLTFERDGGEPVVVRQTIVDSAPDDAARKAVFRALSQAPRKGDGLVPMLDRASAEAAA